MGPIESSRLVLTLLIVQLLQLQSRLRTGFPFWKLEVGGSKSPLIYPPPSVPQNLSPEVSKIAQFDGCDTLNTDGDTSDEE